MMLDASSASGSAQYLLAKIKQASADSIWKHNNTNTADRSVSNLKSTLYKRHNSGRNTIFELPSLGPGHVDLGQTLGKTPPG